MQHSDPLEGCPADGAWIETVWEHYPECTILRHTSGAYVVVQEACVALYDPAWQQIAPEELASA